MSGAGVAEAAKVVGVGEPHPGCNLSDGGSPLHEKPLRLVHPHGQKVVDGSGMEELSVENAEAVGADVSREGVQRDLLPLVEGSTVSTKYGVVRTDHILFIASGAFHVSKPSDLIPELQGRFPIRV